MNTAVSRPQTLPYASFADALTAAIAADSAEAELFTRANDNIGVYLETLFVADEDLDHQENDDE